MELFVMPRTRRPLDPPLVVTPVEGRLAKYIDAAFRTNLLSSVVTTHSYLFNFTAGQRTVPITETVFEPPASVNSCKVGNNE